MYEHILIPTDGSKGAKRGMEAGIELARKYGARVHTLYVVDERVHETPALSDLELVIERLEERGQAAMEPILERAERHGLEAESTVRRGTPYEEIRKYAEAHDVDLIVMGRHGESATSTPYLGSVTERVLRTCDTPVFPV